MIGKIFSTLGNSSSLVPLAIKDCANGLGATAGSAITSKEEARDRFIDEFGTEAIWIGAIPIYKKIIDKTVFKTAKYDSAYDVRNLQNKDILDKTIEHAPTQKIKSSIEKIAKNQKTFKNLNIIKFVASTAMALGTYSVLTDLKQKYTEKRIRTKLIQEKEDESKKKMSSSGIENRGLQFDSFTQIKDKNNYVQPKATSFKGLEGFMLNPVKNMFVLDMGITSERLIKSRSPQEFVGYAIKEAGFLFFMYLLGQKVQNHFEEVADKKHNKSIALDAKVLESDYLKNAFKSGYIEKDLKEFKMTDKGDSQLFDFIKSETDKGVKNGKKNAVIDVAMQSDLIETYKEPKKWYKIFSKSKDTKMLDTRKYLDLEKIRQTQANIEKLYTQFLSSNQSAEGFFKEVRKLKRGSILKNMGSTIISLGVILPSLMVADRLFRGENKEFAVEKRIKEELAQAEQTA